MSWRDLAAQLGFDFGAPPAEAPVAPAAPTRGSGPALAVAPSAAARAPQAPGRQPPSRGRAALRARTAVLQARLEALGLSGVDRLLLVRTRTVMVSHIGRTLRVHEDYGDAPEAVLRAIVRFVTARTKADRLAAREVILSHDVARPPAARRGERPRPGDLALLAQLAAAHRELNARWFGGALRPIAVRLSGRMATRLGHFDPGSRDAPAEIVLSRRHLVRDGWREAMHTLLHEMVHQWQHETGRPVDHGLGFRAKCREVGITPAARRDVTPVERRRARGA